MRKSTPLKSNKITCYLGVTIHIFSPDLSCSFKHHRYLVTRYHQHKNLHVLKNNNHLYPFYPLIRVAQMGYFMHSGDPQGMVKVSSLANNTQPHFFRITENTDCS